MLSFLKIIILWLENAINQSSSKKQNNNTGNTGLRCPIKEKQGWWVQQPCSDRELKLPP